jgi:hypothetical protein
MTHKTDYDRLSQYESQTTLLNLETRTQNKIRELQRALDLIEVALNGLEKAERESHPPRVVGPR